MKSVRVQSSSNPLVNMYLNCGFSVKPGDITALCSTIVALKCGHHHGMMDGANTVMMMCLWSRRKAHRRLGQ